MDKPSPDQIDEVLNECTEHTNAGTSKYPGMSYEDGVLAGIRWMTGEDDANPMA